MRKQVLILIALIGAVVAYAIWKNHRAKQQDNLDPGQEVDIASSQTEADQAQPGNNTRPVDPAPNTGDKVPTGAEVEIKPPNSKPENDPSITANFGRFANGQR